MNQLRELTNSLSHTVRTQTLRLSIILFIAFGSYYKYFQDPINNEHWFHTFLEFIGVAFIFLIVEHALKKTDSGILDPKPLPLDKFIENIGVGKKELILFDTFLETLLLEKNNKTDFEENFRKVIKNNKNFSVKILLLDNNSEYVENRAKDRNDIDVDLYRKRMLMAKQELEHIKNQICLDDPTCDERILIRYYDAPPPFAMYSLDKCAYISFYPKGIKSTDSRQLYIPDDSELGKLLFNFYYTAFESMWEPFK
jgi:hypothetical protein